MAALLVRPRNGVSRRAVQGPAHRAKASFPAAHPQPTYSHFGVRHREDRIGVSFRGGDGVPCGMSLWWLVYNRDDRLLGVVVVEAEALIFARMRMSIQEIDKDATFAEGYELSSEQSRLVPRRSCGKMLSREHAAALLDHIERGKKPQRKRSKVRRR
jgi:hypothetical protein